MNSIPRTFSLGVVLAATLVVTAAHALSAATPSLRLASDGQARLPITISPQASERVRAVAAELADYLGRISSAKFQVQEGTAAKGIVLGTLAEFPNASLAESLAIRDTYDGKEAFAIRTEPERLLLIGATDLAVSHAAFRLLESLGCRWFFPAKAWEVVPSQPELTVSLDEDDRPAILARRIWYGYGAFNDRGHPSGGSTQQDYDTWTRHNRMAGSFKVTAGHAWQAIIAANKAAFAEHPEYLALVKGERKGPQLCVSNPDVGRIATAWALDSLAKHPEAEMVSVECSDGEAQCECEQCAKLGNVSNRVFGLANEVARKVNEKFPGKMVGCLAYGEHSEPPTFELEPNVYVQLTAGFTRGQYTHDELLELWPQKCKHLGHYEYFSVWLWDFDKLPGGKGARIPAIREAIQRYAQDGATSFDAESGNNWGLHGRGYYMANKLLWNPEADVDAILADFYEQSFGPGAPAMRRYYERIAPEHEPLLSRSLLGEAFRDVDEATRLASGRADVQARLDQLKHYLRYVHLRWQWDHAPDKAVKKELAVEILKLVYRTRYEYMNHWAAVRYTFASQAADEFAEPTWKLTDPAPKPWVADQPVTPAETAAWFAEGLDYFQPVLVTEVSFDYDDLVPTALPGSTPVASNQVYQRTQRYALASLAGEPLRVEITTGTIAWYRDRAAARYKLTDAADKVVASGKLPLDGEVHPLDLPVPRAGTYFFECDDSTAGWRIQAAPTQPITWLPHRGRIVLHLGYFQQLYFYVPQGTRELQLFYSGRACKVLGPDGKPIAELAVQDEVTKIPVPAGTDGRCWSLAPHAHSQLWLFNAPNCFAASPSALLLPRKLVERDGIATKSAGP